MRRDPKVGCILGPNVVSKSGSDGEREYLHVSDTGRGSEIQSNKEWEQQECGNYLGS